MLKICLVDLIAEYFVDIDDGLERTAKQTVQISPVVAALLSVMRSYEKSGEKRTQIDSMKIFVSRVLVHLLHLQVIAKKS